MRDMRANGMTYQEIADAVGVSVQTAHNVASGVELSNFGKLQGADGKYRPASYNRQPDANHTGTPTTGCKVSTHYCNA